MTPIMVRTQVYLPRGVHDKLQARAKARRITMAVQIREALEAYLERADRSDSGGILRADEALFRLAGIGEGPADLAAGHDRYVYGSEAGATILREGPATYGRAIRARKAKRTKKRK